MRKKHILLLLGHPSNDSFCGALINAYISGAHHAGHVVNVLRLADMHFDPILHNGYHERQQLESDLILFHTWVRDADHIVFVYPTWWGSMPALLKGFFDRAWIPGFAFRYPKTGWRARLHLREPLLRGKTARIITTSGSPSSFLWFVYGDVTGLLKNNILRFAGISVRTTLFGKAEEASKEIHEQWLKKVKEMGKRGA